MDSFAFILLQNIVSVSIQYLAVHWDGWTDVGRNQAVIKQPLEIYHQGEVRYVTRDDTVQRSGNKIIELHPFLYTYITIDVVLLYKAFDLLRLLLLYTLYWS